MEPLLLLGDRLQVEEHSHILQIQNRYPLKQ
jgi:hypothetical protein